MSKVLKQHRSVQQYRPKDDKQERLLNMRIAEEIDRETFAAKDGELRDHIRHMTLLVDAHGREKSEYADIAIKAL